MNDDIDPGDEIDEIDAADDDEPELEKTTLDTPIGRLTLIASSKGLTHILFDGQDPSDVGLVEPVPTVVDNPILTAAALQLGEYFSGRRHQFDLPLDPRGTEFQVDAWTALASIPYGETVSYADQAKAIGRPTAVRAVGSANGRNPLPIVLPCHRVVGSDGSLTGYAGGIDLKRRLLDHERAQQALPLG